MHLSHVSMSVPDVAGAASFYVDVLGMARHEALPGGVVRLGWGAGFHALELRPGALALDHFGLELPDEDALAAFAAAIGAEPQAPSGDHPPVFGVTDPDGNRVELHGRVDRSGERNADSRSRPIRVQHLALATPDVGRLAGFYEQTLGLRVSDRMGEVFTWLRSDRDHHTVAVVRAERSGLDHYSYDLAGWGDFKHWCDELAKRDVPIAWGPGRHGPGNNLFVMFVDPSGVRVELSAEMERFWDDRAAYPARSWEPVPETVNLWGPMPAWRGEITTPEAESPIA